MEDPRKGYGFQKAVYAVLRVLFGKLFCLITKYRFKPRKIEADTFLLLANHTMDLDPIYAVISTKRHMRFVASANIMRGFPGCLVKWLAGPIPRYKGAPADDVIEAVKKNLECGISVAMYPEGNTTWDGETGYISKRTAELVKNSKGSLVTYRIKGGYLRMPRWAVVKRSGFAYGEVAGEYTRDYLDSLSVDEILSLIKSDLYVNAYKEQETLNEEYRCKALAKGLEATLYVCPCCSTIGKIYTDADTINCQCGAGWKYNLKGFLEPNDKARLSKKDWTDKEYVSVLEWSKWQKLWLKENAKALKEMTEEPISFDHPAYIYGDRIEVEAENKEREKYYFKDISKLSLFRATRLFFTHKGEKKEVFIDSKNGRAGQIYYALWRVCQDKEYI